MKPRLRRCIDCGALVRIWDLDAAALCVDCIDQRADEAERAKVAFDELRAQMGAQHVARTE